MFRNLRSGINRNCGEIVRSGQELLVNTSVTQNRIWLNEERPSNFEVL